MIGESLRLMLRAIKCFALRPLKFGPRATLRNRGGSMRRTRWATGVGAGLLATLAVPGSALATGDDLKDAIAGRLPDAIAINSVWVLVAGILVMFMQAGFAFLEIGFSRGKNVGTVVAKILVNFSIAALC